MSPTLASAKLLDNLGTWRAPKGPPKALGDRHGGQPCFALALFCSALLKRVDCRSRQYPDSHVNYLELNLVLWDILSLSAYPIFPFIYLVILGPFPRHDSCPPILCYLIASVTRSPPLRHASPNPGFLFGSLSTSFRLHRTIFANDFFLASHLRGEQAAAALEANLSNLESKLDAILAALETPEDIELSEPIKSMNIVNPNKGDSHDQSTNNHKSE